MSGADEAAAKLLAVGGSAESAGGKLLALSAGAVLVTSGALVALGAHAVKMAADFQQGLTLLSTSANESEKNLSQVGAGILKMSVDTATGADKLETAMFTVESAGYHGAAGLKVLQAAAEGAKIENADLAQVTDALTTTMHDWREPASQAIDVMNSFREAASIGKMRMDDFTGAMKNVGPVASLAKIPLTDVEAALSTMSLEGDKGASAGTHLAQSLLNMIAPSTKAKGVLQEIGLTAQQVSDGMQKSLPDTLKMITDAIGKKFPEGSQKYNEAMSAMFGGTRGLKAILELTGANLKDFTNDANDLAPIMKQNATNVEGWSQVQGNFNFKLQAAGDAVQALFIKAGTQLLPIFSKMLDAVTPLIVSFSNWIDKDNVLTNAFNKTVSAVQSSINFYQQWKPVIDTTATALAFFFVPALIKVGIEAVVSAAKITYNFVASLILTGAQGWAAAGKLAVFIASLIVTGTTAVINAAKVTVSFIASLIATASAAYASAFAVTGSLVPALGIVGIQAVSAGGKLAVNLVQGLVAARTASLAATPAIAGVGTAATVAAGPIIALGAIAAGTFLLIANKAYIMDKSVQTSTGEMVGAAQLRYHQLAAGASSSGQQIETDLSNHANTAKKNVIASFDSMNFWVRQDSGEMSGTAKRIFGQLVKDVNGDWSQLDQDTKDYWNGIAAYIDNKSGLAAAAANYNFSLIHMPDLTGAQAGTLLHFAGNAEGTDYWRGGPTWVGEKGPELLNVPRGAQIIPNNKIGSMGGSAPVIHNHIDVYLDGSRMTGQLMPRIVQQVRQATGVRF